MHSHERLLVINIIYRQLGTMYTLDYIVILLMMAAVIIWQDCRCCCV